MIKKSRRQDQLHKVVVMFVVMVACFMVLTGCKQNKDNQNSTEADAITTAPVITDAAEEQDNESTDISNEVTEVPADNEEIASDTENDTKEAVQPEETEVSEVGQSEETFYGNWVISQVLAYGQAGTYSKEDAEALIGNTLIFSSEQATCFGDQASYLDQVAVDPVYTQTEISSNDFMTNYRNTFANLGVETDSMKEVVAADSQGNGCTFFIKDENTLILVGGGTFFQLERANEE